MTDKPEPDDGWSAATWKGSRLQQHREFHALPFSRKLELLEELSEMAARFRSAPGTAGSPSVLREEPKTGQTGRGQE